MKKFVMNNFDQTLSANIMPLVSSMIYISSLGKSNLWFHTC